MKVILAPNTLKGSLTALDATIAMSRGIANIPGNIDVVQLPVADGGDGTLEVLKRTLLLESCFRKVTGPSLGTVNAEFLFDQHEKLAIIEMSKSTGLALLVGQRLKPLEASSFGLGELILAALDKGAEKLLIGIGGSATNDAGIGMLIALGVLFLDAEGKQLIGNGLSLEKIVDIDLTHLDPRIKSVSINVLCDVNNTVLGYQGAARVFAVQKGATEKEVEYLEVGMENYVRVVQTQLGHDMTGMIGGGAAGGIGASLMAILNAQLLPGSDTILDILNFDEFVVGADLVLTAEGRLDAQTLSGKIPFKVAERAKRNGVPCIAITGCINNSSIDLLSDDFTACFSLCSCPMDLSTAMENASTLLCNSTEQIVRCFLAGNAQ